MFQSITQQFISYTLNSIETGRHISTFTRSSSGPQKKQIKDYIDVLQKRILGSQMLTECYRGTVYIVEYMCL